VSVRSLMAYFTTVPDLEIPMLPFDGGAAKIPWQSRWAFQRGDKLIRIAVLIRFADGRLELTDARDFIERLAEFEPYTSFELLIEQAPVSA
jgi:hypothetical protein